MPELCIKEILSKYCTDLKTRPIPLSDIIPTLQKAKDRIQELEQEVLILKNPKLKLICSLLKPKFIKEHNE